nr:unnamed protein product [Callosobruchus chinensis]CAH7722741.1 unnamed protein product [Callosobruchus chinensis]CAH7732082.1 unnamed protein product [Callosobruchus chinensis]CAH7741447.1 unnamed protein product [Callosobruchus chinensis]CAH7753455.1 unnamed protein product [Callosobruchus chinensis]
MQFREGQFDSSVTRP